MLAGHKLASSSIANEEVYIWLPTLVKQASRALIPGVNGAVLPQPLRTPLQQVQQSSPNAFFTSSTSSSGALQHRLL